MNRKILVFFLGFILLISACKYDNEEDLYSSSNCETDDMSYVEDITPILTNYRCISCHNTTSPGGSVDLDSYDEVKIYVDNGRLLGSIKHSDGFSAMPQFSSQMAQCDIDKIEAWIYDGAKNN